MRDAQGSWGVTLLCFLSRVMVTKVIIYNGLYSTRYYTLLYIYYTSQFKRMREKETSDEKTEVKDQEHSG